MARKRRKALPDRRDAILRAALAVFSENGFGAARMGDIAQRAEVAKGTLYLYFKSKEALFKALIESVAALPLAEIEALLRNEAQSSEALLRAMLDIVRTEILGTERWLVVQLVLTEVHRFPDIAEFHYANVVSRVTRFLRTVLERGVARGEFQQRSLLEFPQLVIAPFLLAVIWRGAFERQAPLDIQGLLDAHLETLLAGLKRAP